MKQTIGTIPRGLKQRPQATPRPEQQKTSENTGKRQPRTPTTKKAKKRESGTASPGHRSPTYQTEARKHPATETKKTLEKPSKRARNGSRHRTQKPNDGTETPEPNHGRKSKVRFQLLVSCVVVPVVCVGPVC